jgi:hypothetical protein
MANIAVQRIKREFKEVLKSEEVRNELPESPPSASGGRVSHPTPLPVSPWRALVSSPSPPPPPARAWDGRSRGRRRRRRRRAGVCGGAGLGGPGAGSAVRAGGPRGSGTAALGRGRAGGREERAVPARGDREVGGRGGGNWILGPSLLRVFWVIAARAWPALPSGSRPLQARVCTGGGGTRGSPS